MILKVENQKIDNLKVKRDYLFYLKILNQKIQKFHAQVTLKPEKTETLNLKSVHTEF